MAPKITKSASSKDKNTLKILVIRKICENKVELFGSFTPTITRELKQKKWEEIYEYALSIGFLSTSNSKDWTYIRDTVWPNWKKRTLAKSDANKKTGNGADESTQLNDLDEAVLDVFGRESATVVGIRNATESLEMDNSELHPATELVSQTSFDEQERDFPMIESTVKKGYVLAKKCKDTEVKEYDNKYEEEIIVIKKKKVALQVEHLELANYKMKLEILELEDRLNLQHKYPIDTPKTFNFIDYTEQAHIWPSTSAALDTSTSNILFKD